MPQSLARLHIHLVFSTKHREPLITDTVRDALHAYMATVLQNLGCAPVLINSVEDHTHLLFDLARTVSISQAVEDVKNPLPDGSKPKVRNLPDLRGKPDTGLSPFLNPMSKPSGSTLPTSANTTGRKHFRRNTGPSLYGITLPSMNGMCGIEIRSGLQPSIFFDSYSQGVALGCLEAGALPLRSTNGAALCQPGASPRVGCPRVNRGPTARPNGCGVRGVGERSRDTRWRCRRRAGNGRLERVA